MQRLLGCLTLLFLLASCAAPLEAAPQQPAPAGETQTVQASPVPLQATNLPTQAPLAASPTAPEAQASPLPVAAQRVAYVGADANIWLMDVASAEETALSTDGSTQMGTSVGEISVRYSDLKWSDDGRYLAFQKESMTQLADRADFQESIWVYDTESSETRMVLENLQISGFNWQPGMHAISYALSTDPGYFTGRGEVDAALAKGIWLVDADSGEQHELVQPQGYSLVLPRWSADGKIVVFNEIYLMEGSGQFAGYDLAAQKYFSWGKPVGGYDIALDGNTLAYDNLTYTPSGEERIVLNTLQGDQETLFSTGLAEKEYAFAPHFSPDGAYLAYQISSGLDDPQTYRLVVQPVNADAGAPRTLLQSDNIAGVEWSADGSQLLVTVGPYDAPQIVLVNFADGSSQTLAQGWMPAWQPLRR